MSDRIFYFTARMPGVFFAGMLLVVFVVVNGVSGRAVGAALARGGDVPAGLNTAEWTQISSQRLISGQEAKLAADDAQISDFFGNAIAVDGDTVVVGAFGEKGGLGDPIWHAGAAYIFERDQGGTGNWGQAAKLTAGDPGFMDQFGQVVAISGSTVAVGAPYENGGDGNPIPDAGAVYIFERDQGGVGNWGQVVKVTAGDTGEDDNFGLAVSLSGDTLVVGAPGEDGGPGDPMPYVGAVYVFERDEGGPDNWGQVTKLVSSDAQGGDGFGSAVAVNGDTLVAGSPTEDGGPGDPMNWAGAAYVFERNEGGPDNWGEVVKLTGSDTQTFDHFGFAAAIDGDTIIVGAPFEEGGPGDPLFVAGAAYVFERNQGGPGNWGEVARLAASDPGEGDYFGRQVSVSGDTVISGSPNESGGPGDPLSRAGAAYIFRRDQGGAGNWGETVKLMAGDAEADDVFGSAVAVNNDGLFFIGAADGDVDGPPPVQDSGVAYIFSVNIGVEYMIYLPAVLELE
jgi:hypothetical protein